MTGASPIVDMQNARSQNVLTREVLDTLPTSRASRRSRRSPLGALTTGQALGGGDAGGSKGDTVFGFAQIHGSLQGIRTLDGMKLSSAYNCRGLDAEPVQPDDGAGNRAGHERPPRSETESSGLNMNMVPKDGGNPFTARFNVEGHQQQLPDRDNLSDELRARGLTAAAPIRKIYDVGGGVGGPIHEGQAVVLRRRTARGAASRTSPASTSTSRRTRRRSRRAIIAAASFQPSTRPTRRRPAFYDRYTRDAALRLT